MDTQTDRQTNRDKQTNQQTKTKICGMYPDHSVLVSETEKKLQVFLMVEAQQFFICFFKGLITALHTQIRKQKQKQTSNLLTIYIFFFF